MPVLDCNFSDDAKVHGGVLSVYMTENTLITSGKRAFGQDPLVPASIWAGTKGPATSPEIRQPPGRL
jgi:hypothetical protein